MDILELGAIGELVSGLAVVGSLIFVGLQIRQSNQLNQAESVRAFARDYNNLLMHLKKPDLLDIWRRGSIDFDSLSGSEKSQVHLVLLYHFVLGWADSKIDPSRSGPFAAFLDQAFGLTVRAPGFAQWWRQFKRGPESLSPGYAAYIDDLPKLKGGELLEAMPWFEPNESDTRGA